MTKIIVLFSSTEASGISSPKDKKCMYKVQVQHSVTLPHSFSFNVFQLPAGQTEMKI